MYIHICIMNIYNIYNIYFYIYIYGCTHTKTYKNWSIVIFRGLTFKIYGVNSHP